MNDTTNPVWLTTREGMAVLGCCERLFRKYLAQGKITRYTRNMRDNKYLLSEVQALKSAIEDRKLRR